VGITSRGQVLDFKTKTNDGGGKKEKQALMNQARKEGGKDDFKAGALRIRDRMKENTKMHGESKPEKVQTTMVIPEGAWAMSRKCGETKQDGRREGMKKQEGYFEGA